MFNLCSRPNIMFLCKNIWKNKNRKCLIQKNFDISLKIFKLIHITVYLSMDCQKLWE